MGDYFSTNGLIEKNVKKLNDIVRIKKESSPVLVVVGKAGEGKSCLSIQIARYIEEELMDREYSMDTNTYTHNQWKDRTVNEIRATNVYHEGRHTFVRRAAMTAKNKEGLNVLSMWRKNYIFHLINFQNIGDVDPKLLLDHAHALIRCVKQGWVWGYGANDVKRIGNQIDRNGKVRKWPTPGFRAGFRDLSKYEPEFWERCNEHNRKQLKESYKDEENKDEKPIYDCAKCDHKWQSRKKVGKPARCPNCDTKKWE